MARDGITPTQIEEQITAAVDPILATLEALADARKTDAEKITAAEAALEHIESQIAGLDEWETALSGLSTQQRELETRLHALAQTTVGTKEYQQAQHAVAETLSSLVEMTTGLVPAMSSIQNTLSDLATMYKATLELSRSPVQLSDTAASAISSILSAQLSKTLSSAIRDLVRAEVRAGYAQMQETVGHSVDRVEAAHDTLIARLHRLLDRMTAAADKYSVAVSKIEDRTAVTVRLAVWLAVTATVAIAAVAVTGVALQGVLGLLGVGAGMSELWTRAWDANTWYAGLGWGVLAVALTGGLVAGLGWCATRMWRGLEDLVRSTK
ncbi:hypothetical protein CAPI_01605 [Corynebacterium capitovis DSM 44611]|uniref:hypothetical protein n=1 Tax=Corynebacterium capitovis TaxID=131081 RepID=UPI000377E768|nr:hypothetical protein [Corynebacterium capitovis]WKD56895.1 hypothetical protein CAPI_01605 [Corynebacterium capitovis DSM 44611]